MQSPKGKIVKQGTRAQSGEPNLLTVLQKPTMRGCYALKARICLGWEGDMVTTQKASEKKAIDSFLTRKDVIQETEHPDNLKRTAGGSWAHTGSEAHRTPLNRPA